MAHINVFYESKVHVLQEIEYNEQMFWVFIGKDRTGLSQRCM